MKNGLSNPALIAGVLQSKAGQKVLENSANVQAEWTKLGFTLLKLTLLATAGYLVYRKIAGAFVKQSEDKRYLPANLSVSSASIRANNLYKAMYGFASDFDKVVQNLQGVNHNGYIRIYNEFGARPGADFKKLTLTQWLYDQFNDTQIAQLKFITNNAIT